jgi:hypothetical protein
MGSPAPEPQPAFNARVASAVIRGGKALIDPTVRLPPQGFHCKASTARLGVSSPAEAGNHLDNARDLFR